MSPGNEELKVFFGTSHPELGSSICNYLESSAGEITISRFTGGEIYARIKENIRGQHCVIIQTCSQDVNENYMELFIIVDAMKRASARSITAVIPHFGYARQDRKAASREPISARLMSDLLTTAGVTRVVTVDLHSDQIQGFFSVPLDHLTAMPIFEQYLKGKNLPDPVVVAPDTGRAKVAKKLADRIGADLAILHKVRPKQQQSAVTHLVGDVENKTVIITDDLIDTAGTATAGVEVLRKSGCRPDIYMVATHGLLSPPAAERFTAAKLKEVVITDTIPISKDKMFPGLTVLSTAELLGEAILRNFENKSITSLFD